MPKGGCAGEAKRKIGKGLDDSAAREINMAGFKFSLDDEKAMIGKKEEVLQDARKETERSVKNASEALRGNL